MRCNICALSDCLDIQITLRCEELSARVFGLHGSDFCRLHPWRPCSVALHRGTAWNLETMPKWKLGVVGFTLAL